METNDHDGAAVRIPPPLIFLGAILVGLAFQRFVYPVPLDLPTLAKRLVGGILLLAGLGLMGGAIGLFRRTEQDPKPWKSTPEIISTGVYRWTRNPMYVGMALIQAGIGLALANGWVVVLVLPVAALVYRTAIRHEEAYLETKFGEEYLRYRRSVRRWF